MPSSITITGFGDVKETPVRLRINGVGDSYLIPYILEAGKTLNKFTAHSSENDNYYDSNCYAFANFDNSGNAYGAALGGFGIQGPNLDSLRYYPPTRGFGDERVLADPEDADNFPDEDRGDQGAMQGFLGGFGDVIDFADDPGQFDPLPPMLGVGGRRRFSDEGGDIMVVQGRFFPGLEGHRVNLNPDLRVRFKARHGTLFPKIGGAYSAIPGQGDVIKLSPNKSYITFSVPALPLGEYSVLIYWHKTDELWTELDEKIQIVRRNRSKILYELRRKLPNVFKTGPVSSREETNFP